MYLEAGLGWSIGLAAVVTCKWVVWGWYWSDLLNLNY